MWSLRNIKPFFALMVALGFVLCGMVGYAAEVATYVYKPGLYGGEKNSEQKMWKGPLIAGSAKGAALYPEAGVAFDNGNWTYTGEMCINRAGKVTFAAGFWDGASVTFNGTKYSLGSGALTAVTIDVAEPGWYPIVVNLWRTSGRGGTTWSFSSSGLGSNAYKDPPEVEGFRYAIADEAVKTGYWSDYKFPVEDGSVNLLRVKQDGLSYTTVGMVTTSGSQVTIPLTFSVVSSPLRVTLYYDTVDRGAFEGQWLHSAVLSTNQRDSSATFTANCISGGGEVVGRLRIAPAETPSVVTDGWVEWSEPFTFELEPSVTPVYSCRVIECSLTTAKVETVVEVFGGDGTAGTLSAAVTSLSGEFGDFVTLANSPSEGRLTVTNELVNLGFGKMRCRFHLANNATEPTAADVDCEFTCPDEPMVQSADGLVQFEVPGNHYNDSPFVTNLATDVRLTSGAIMTRYGSSNLNPLPYVDPADGREFTWEKTYVYRGSMYLKSNVIYHFGHNAYDYARLDIGGMTVYASKYSSGNNYGTFTPDRTGLYPFEYRQTHVNGGSGCGGSPYTKVAAAFWTEYDRPSMTESDYMYWHGYFNDTPEFSVFSSVYAVMNVQTFQRLSATRYGVTLSASQDGGYALFAEFATDYLGSDASKWSAPVKIADVPEGDGSIWEFDIPSGAVYVRFRYRYASGVESITESAWIPGAKVTDTSLPAGDLEAFSISTITATGAVATVSVSSLGGTSCALTLRCSTDFSENNFFEIPLGSVDRVGTFNIPFAGLAPHRTYAVELKLGGSGGDSALGATRRTLTTADGTAQTVVDGDVPIRPLIDYRSIAVTNLISGDNVWLTGRLFPGSLIDGVTIRTDSYVNSPTAAHIEDTVLVAADGTFNIRLSGAKPGQSCIYEVSAVKGALSDDLDATAFTPAGRATDSGSQYSSDQRQVTYSLNVTPGCNETIIRIDLSLDDGVTYTTAITTNLPAGAAKDRYSFTLPVPEFGLKVRVRGYVDNYPTIPENHTWDWDGTGGSQTVYVEDKATYTWRPEVADGAWENAANWTASKADNMGYPQYKTAAASFADCASGSVVRVVSDRACTIDKLNLGDGPVVTLVGACTCLRVNSLISNGSTLAFEVPLTGYTEVPLARVSDTGTLLAPSALSVVVAKGSPIFRAKADPAGMPRRMTLVRGVADAGALTATPQPRLSRTTPVVLEDNTALGFDLLTGDGGSVLFLR